MRLIGVCAMDRNGCIGKNGSIPWHYKEDFQYFKKLTLDSTVIMGHSTWKSLPMGNKPLRNRRNVILSRTKQGEVIVDDVYFTDIEKLDGLLRTLKEPHYLIGGEKAFAALWHHIVEFRVTTVSDIVENGDTFIPKQFFTDFIIDPSTTLPLSENCTVSKYVRR